VTSEIVKSIAKMHARAGPILRRLPAGPCSMVEVGTAGGLLAAYLLAQRHDLTLHCVDSWLAGELQPESYKASGDAHATLSQREQDDIRALARERLQTHGERVTVHQMDSLMAAVRIERESIDLVFLDADHSAEGVSADLLAWWPVVRSGGALGSHDFSNRDPRFRFGVDAAVKRFAARLGLAYDVDEGNTVWLRKVVA